MPCRAKENIPVFELHSLVRRMNFSRQFSSLLEKSGRTPGELEDMLIEFHSPARDSGGSPVRLSMQTLLDEARMLDDLMKCCDGCDAARGASFGCLGSINYPISAMAEEWILSLCRNALGNGGRCRALLDLVCSENIDGSCFADVRRSAGGCFFELDEAPRISFGKTEISTDQLLEAIFGRGELGSEALERICFFSGGVRVSESGPDCKFPAKLWRGDSLEAWLVFSLPPGGTDDSSILAFKSFFEAVFVSWCIGCSVGVEF